MRNLALPELEDSAVLILNQDRRLTDDEYEAFCVANTDLRIERTASGEILIMPPTGAESDYQNVDVISQLSAWAKSNGRGKAFGSSIQFILPDGSAKSPDAAWISNEKLSLLTKAARKRFLHLAPEFVVEVISDRLAAAQQKMHEWIANGVELAWLIHGDAKTIYVYRPNQPVEKFQNISSLTATGPIEGCTFQLEDIWAGL